MIAKASVCELHHLDGRSRPVYYYLLLFSYVNVYARVKDKRFLAVFCVAIATILTEMFGHRCIDVQFVM